MWWEPKQFNQKLPNLKIRLEIIKAIRNFFNSEDFLEVETPALQISPGLEPHLHPFKSELKKPGSKKISYPFYLHTSPEFTMKKLLVAGLPKIFQFAKVYRNNERSHTHHPEFTMLEWYRSGVDYKKIMSDCEAILRATLEASDKKYFRWNNKTSTPFEKWEYLTVEEAFLKHTAIQLKNTIDNPLIPSVTSLKAEAKKISVDTNDNDTWEDIYFRIFLEKIEMHLGSPTPTILYDYPISMAALSRAKASNRNLAERFEIYVCGMELANAFSELTDAATQRERFLADIRKKEMLYGETIPLDEDFLKALRFGLPESAGIALGVDRLTMLCTGANHIEAVLWAPVADFSE